MDASDMHEVVEAASGGRLVVFEEVPHRLLAGHGERLYRVQDTEGRTRATVRHNGHCYFVQRFRDARTSPEQVVPQRHARSLNRLLEKVVRRVMPELGQVPA